jgi:peptidoglycan/xylan/chitin deacetylase (PgdA/CDA1 family)
VAAHRRRSGGLRLAAARGLRAAAVAGVVMVLLAGAGYWFVVKSFPYQTPQLPPPRVGLTADEVSDFTPGPAGLDEVPVLAWRDVSRRPGNLTTTPERFATELALLRADGFASIAPAALAAVAAGRRVRLPARPVVLTFDDGLATDWTTVDPILRRYGFTAMVFVSPARLAAKSPSYFLTRAELAAMASSGRWTIGVWLSDTWRSAAAAGRAAEAEKAQLEHITGHQVVAGAWPVPRVPSRHGLQAPQAFGHALRRDFAVVFGRPAAGPVSYVVPGSARRPFPRAGLTAADTPLQLSARLRAGIQAPPPHDPLAAAWTAAAGGCRVRAGRARLTTRSFALCTPVLNGSRWQDYTLRLDVSADPVGTTAVVDLRVSANGCVEVALGRSGLAVKERAGRRWTILRQIQLALGPYGALLGGEPMTVTIRLRGNMMLIHAGAVTLYQRLRGDITRGVIALGAVSPGGRAAVTYSGVSMVSSSPPRSPGT